MKTATQQTSYFIAFFIIVILLAGSNYLQFYIGINPCPLCILQRITMGMLGILFLFGTMLSFKQCVRLSVGLLGALVGILGMILSGRQVWLQHLPKNLLSDANCDASLQYMLQVLPLDQVIKKIFAGGTACSQVEWLLVHLSLAEWSLISFALFTLFSLFQLFRRS